MATTTQPTPSSTDTKNKQHLYVDKVQTSKSPTGNTLLNLTAKNQTTGNYVTNANGHNHQKLHSQTIGLESFNKILNANGHPSVSQDAINKVSKQTSTIANGKNNLGFDANVFQTPTGLNKIDQTSISQCAQPFNYARQMLNEAKNALGMNNLSQSTQETMGPEM